MRPTIVVDANPIISALLGGFSREILFNHNFEFITTEYTIKEVEKYMPYISKKSGVSVEYINSLLKLIPIKVYKKEKYNSQTSEAKSLIIDIKDVDILALTLYTGFPIWSNDIHFENIEEISLIKTKDFV